MMSSDEKDPNEGIQAVEEGERNEESPAVNEKPSSSPQPGTSEDQDSREQAASGSRKPSINWLVYTVILLLIIAAVVVPTTIHLLKDDDDDDKENQKVYSPIYDTSELPLYNEDVLRGYANAQDFRNDMTIAAQQFVNNVAGRSSGDPRYASLGWGWQSRDDGAFGGGLPVMEAGDTAVSAPTADKQESTSDGDTVDDYGTNNQEEGIEEGDIIVASENAVYAAYGQYLLSWNATSGKRFHTIKIENELMAADDPYSWYSWVGIQSLLLHENRLLVVVQGNFDPEQNYTTTMTRVLGSYLQTRILIYDVGSNGDQMNLITRKDINGYFSAVRSEGGNVHLVTTSGVNMYPFLGSPIEIDYYDDTPPSLSTYYVDVKKEADESLIPKFIDQLESELTVDGVFPRTVRLCRWQTEESSHPMGDFVYGNGFVNSVALITSFDMANAPIAATLMDVHTTAAFLPSHYGEAYATSGMMLIATTGYDYDSDRERMMEKTYMLALALESATSTPHAIGSVDGYFLNQRSFDIFDNTLRVATSIRNFWWWERDEVSQESSTENYVMTLDLPSATQEETHRMNVLDKIKLGKPDELFTAVRFFDNVAYAVTFERTDPFYVLNVTDRLNLEVLAEVEITGFSSYLHSMNDENCLILAIGEEADEDGRALGLQISVFNACDLGNVEVTRHNIETEDNVHSYSNAQWDVKAFRFNRETGRLILPVDMYSWGDEKPWGEETKNGSTSSSFHGFKTYIVTADSITESCSVQTGNDQDDMGICYSCQGSFSPRSMIFGGDLMTTKAHFVTSIDLDTCTQVWQFKVTLAEEEQVYGCCGYR